METTSSSGNLQSVERALDIILTLYRKNRPMGINELARMMGVSPSTIHRSVSTLEYKGFLFQNPDNNKYFLSSKLYAIGMVAGNSISWIEEAKPLIKDLSSEFCEKVNLLTFDETNKEELMAVMLYSEDMPIGSFYMTEQIGVSTECYCTASGKVLLAFANPKWDIDSRIRKTKFTRYTKNTITDPDTLFEKLEEIREHGYAEDDEEMVDAMYCISCPILSFEGHALASISLSGPKARIIKLDKEYVLSRLRDTAARIANLIE